MWTIFVAIYAILTIDFFDIKFYSVCNFEFSFDSRRFKLDNLSDFLDDFQALSDKENDPRKLLEMLNQ